MLLFTHDIEMPSMLPGIAPTGQRVEIALVAVIAFRDGKVASEHIYWDQPSVLAQIGDRRLLVLMDEYELLENKVEEGKLSKDLFTFMASLIDNHDKLSFVFTGSRKLEERDRRNRYRLH